MCRSLRWAIPVALVFLPGCTGSVKACTWSIVAAPDPADESYFADVLAFSDSDVWAVGSASEEHHVGILHWNGQRWESPPTPFLDWEYNSLSSLAGTAPNDIWATGASAEEGTNRSHPLALHWDGRVWSDIPTTPISAIRGGLSDVIAVAPDDVWSVGWYGWYGEFAHVEHWDGGSWKAPGLSLPRSGRDVNDHVRSISAVSSDDVWAIGNQSNAQGAALVLHWDGRRWRQVEVPTREEQAAGVGHLLWDQMEEVLAMGKNDVWLVGTGARASVRNGTVDTTGGSVPTVVHWDGQGWTASMPGDGLAADDWGQLTGASRGLDGSAWAVGEIQVSGHSQTVAYRLTGSRWVETPTPFIAPAPRHMDDFRSNGLVGHQRAGLGRGLGGRSLLHVRIR